MTIALTPEQRQLIEQQLATGSFTSQGEVIDEALNLLQRRSKLLKQLNADIQEGLDDLKAGRATRISTPEEAEAFKQEIIKHGNELRAQREQTAH